MIRLLFIVALLLCGSKIAVSQSQVVIDPDQRTGATVRYFGWDMKLHANLCHTPKSAKWLYEACSANIMRIPLRPRASTAEAMPVFEEMHRDKKKDRGYGPLLKSIKAAKQVNPDVNVFVSTKLLSVNTFPDWMATKEKGRIFGKEVARPDTKKFALLYSNYIEHLAGEGIKVDFLGINNEFGGAVTPQMYVSIAKHIKANLKKSKIPNEFKEFQWIGSEEFGIDGSVKYARGLAGFPSAVKYTDVLGSHFYPDKYSGKFEAWKALASFGAPTWHTEVHVRRHQTAAENINALRDGMAIVFKTNQTQCEGYIWWDGTSHPGFLDNFVRRAMINSMLYGGCVKTSGEYSAKDNPAGLRLAQATRVGDTVSLWYFNPSKAFAKLPVKLESGVIDSATAMCFRGGSKVTPQSMPELAIKPASKSEFSVERIPANSVVLVKIQLKDDEELIPLQEWQKATPKKETFEASLSKVSKSVFLFRSSKGKAIRVPVKSLDPKHYPEIQDALKAHGIQ